MRTQRQSGAVPFGRLRSFLAFRGIDSRAAAVYNLSVGLDVGNKCRKGSQIRSVALRHGDLVPSIGSVLYVIRDKETEGKTERRGIIRNREGHIRSFETDRKKGNKFI